MNLPERIVFVVDTARERNCTPFRLSTGASYMPLLMIKRIVENFVCTKSVIRANHEYALMILTSGSVQWICDFTNNTNSIINQLNALSEDFMDEDQNSYDFCHFFDKIQEKLFIEERHNEICSMFVPRIILVYSRSIAIPKFEITPKFLDTAEERGLVIDILYVHEPPSLENSCEEIYSRLAALNLRTNTYILEAGRNAAKLHNNMAKLLGHPRQRPMQSRARYAILGYEEIILPFTHCKNELM